MDLSAVIFVVLALAWAAYLIPKALKHHDEMASDRLVQGHSDKVRILSRKARAAAAEVAEAIIPDKTATPDESLEPTPEPRVREFDGVGEVHEVHPVPAADLRPTRAAARKAAARRRRVLAVLVAVLVVVWGLTWAAYLPFLAPVVPGALVVAWLVVARLSVRRQQQTRRQQHRPVVPADAYVETFGATATATVTTAVVSGSVEAPVAPSSAEEFLDRLADEDTGGIAREEIEVALASDGSLWDPLPMTLPTYVNKARARRTVRTIELTGISSSGHDETDSALAREAADAAREAADHEADSEARRKAAGA